MEEDSYAPFPERMHQDIRWCLGNERIKELKVFQAELFENALAGRHVAVSCPASRDRSLALQLPVLDAILEEPAARVIFVYPSRAAAAGQYRSLYHWMEYLGRDRIRIGIYDEETRPAERGRIRKNANIILTSPRMLGGVFLRDHDKYGFEQIFENLRYVVAEELQDCEPISFADTFRRLKAVCACHGRELAEQKASCFGRLQFLCSVSGGKGREGLAGEVIGENIVVISPGGRGKEDKAAPWAEGG